MNIWTYIPFLNLGFGAPIDGVTVEAAKTEIRNYCQEVNQRHGNHIARQDIDAVVDDATRLLRSENVNGLVERSRITSIKKKFLPRLILGCPTTSLTFSTTNVQPDTIALYDALYLIPPYQTDEWSCAFWSLFNAQAINQLLAAGQPLSSEAISARSRGPALEFIGQCKNGWREARELVRAVRAFRLLNVTILGPYGGDHGRPLEDIWPAEAVADEADFDAFGGARGPVLKVQILAGIRRAIDRSVHNNEQGAHHFVCQIGNVHWILLSVVKLRDRNPILIILDSKHWPIGPRSSAVRYIQFAHQLFVAPYYAPRQ